MMVLVMAYIMAANRVALYP